MFVSLKRSFFFRGNLYEKGLQNIKGITKELLPKGAEEVKVDPATLPEEEPDVQVKDTTPKKK